MMSIRFLFFTIVTCLLYQCGAAISPTDNKKLFSPGGAVVSNTVLPSQNKVKTIPTEVHDTPSLVDHQITNHNHRRDEKYQASHSSKRSILPKPQPIKPFSVPNKSKISHGSPVKRPVSAQDRIAKVKRPSLGNASSKNKAKKSNTPKVLIWLIGLEGSGHHAVEPVLLKLAEACGKSIRKRKESEMLVQNKLHRNLANEGPNILLASSFPCNGLRTAGNHWRFDIQSLTQRMNYSHIRLKYLYLDRDPVRMVTSHCDFATRNGLHVPRNSTSCIEHAKTLLYFKNHIEKEYNVTMHAPRVEWRQIAYEKYLNHSECAELMLRLSNFFEWNTCDFERVCKYVQSNVSRTHGRNVSHVDSEYILSKNWTINLPSIM